MLMGWLLLAVGVAGFSIAGWLDLKTTEFPDWLPYSMIVIALLIHGAFAVVTEDLSILFNSVMIGLIFLGFGLLLYFAKQWGDGDAWLFGALGFLFPNPSGFQVPVFINFPLTLLTNFLAASLIYLIIYSLFLGIRNPRINGMFLKELRRSSREMSLMSGAFFGISWGAAAFFILNYGTPLMSVWHFILLPFLMAGILLFIRYGRIIEGNLFKRKISSRDLKVGDVILKGRWKGATKKEIDKLRKHNEHIWIKEGVRFAPVFVITILITFLIGDFILLFI